MENRVSSPDINIGSSSQVRLEIEHFSHGHTFIFRYTEARRQDLFRHLGKLASDPSSPFSWYDAAVVSRKVINTKQQS